MEVLGSEVAGQYRGVRKRKWKWVSEIRVPGKKTRIWLGSFESPEMAAVAHDVAALRLRGRDARLNFPGLVDRFRRPATADPGDMRAAAKEAAAQVQFRPDLVRPAAGPAVGGDDVAWDALIRVCEELAADSPQMWAELAEAMLLPPPIWNCNPAEADEWADGWLWDSPVWHY